MKEVALRETVKFLSLEIFITCLVAALCYVFHRTLALPARVGFLPQFHSVTPLKKSNEKRKSKLSGNNKVTATKISQ